MPNGGYLECTAWSGGGGDMHGGGGYMPGGGVYMPGGGGMPGSG